LMDRATRPNNPSSEPEMLPDRPLPISVGMDPSPPPLEIASSITLPSLVPTDISDEASASFHSTPDFHHTPQTLSSHTYLELPTTTTGPAGPDFYTGPLPVPTTTNPAPKLYTGPHDQEISPGHPAKLYTYILRFCYIIATAYDKMTTVTGH